MSIQRAPLVSAEPLARREPLPGFVDARGLSERLRANVEGEVRFDDGSKAMYAVDASNYRQIPIGVVCPKSIADVEATVAACRAYGAPLVSRGGGTALAGQTVNAAIVIDWSKYMNHILELDPRGGFARVEPGVVCDDVVHAAKPYRLTWGPQPATHTHCCFGGMLGNNSCGIHAQMAGKAVDNTLELDVLLYDGTRMQLGWMTDASLDATIRRGGREGEIYARLRRLRDAYAPLIRARFPDVPRRVSGYNLDQLLPGEDGRFNLARALVGSEGTCVTIVEAKVRLVYNHPERVLVVLGYPDVYHAADHVVDALKYHPIGLEGLDERLRRDVLKKGGPHAELVPLLPEGDGFLMVELGYDTKEEAIDVARRLMDDLGRAKDRPAMKLLIDDQEQQNLWKVRESGLGATAWVPGQPGGWPGWEDSAVAPAKLGGYLRELRLLFTRYDLEPSLYGHFGMGCVHCRVPFELMTEGGVRRFRAFLDDAADLVVRYGGSLSGEHGDGQARAELLPKMFGPELVEAFREFKSIWDPDGKMNPHKVVEPYSITENLRLGPSYAPAEPETHFRFPEDHGSFAAATLRCAGIGNCRRTEGEPHNDVMCPSYMVTHEERHSTRGRAHLLHEMLVDGPVRDGWRDENVKTALDLCLACKGCKGDCPVDVDMATYKAEFLSHYFEGRIRPRQAYAFGLVDQWARLASAVPGLVNLVTRTPGLRALAKLAAGMPQEREIPAFAPETFKAWFARRPKVNVGQPKVVLFADTFNNFFLPDTAQAAVEVLEALGREVEVPMQHLCCGRPLYDCGMLGTAKLYLRRLLEQLRPHLDARTPIVVLEPSCAAVFRDELLGLYPDRADAHRLSEQVVVLSEYLAKNADGWEPPRLARQAVVQGHCHHKSIMRFEKEEHLLERMGLRGARDIAAGCCGMAGSFGFEKGKYDVSIAAGERKLLKAVREASPSTLIIADGFSCREQIRQTTGRHALHLAEVLKLALDHGPAGPALDPPERRLVRRRKAARVRSMARTVTIGVTLVAGAMLLSKVQRLRSGR